MPLRSTTDGWGLLARGFHWVVAALILVQAAVGLYMVGMSLSPDKLRVYALHKSIGLTVLALVLLRLAWRLPDRRPDDPAGTPAWQHGLARAAHAVLYLLILAIPLSGWWFNSASNAPLSWFGLVRIPSLTGGLDLVWKPRALLLHQGLFWILVAILVLHVGAALWHHYRRRDDVLRRMLRTTKPGNGAAR